MRDAEVSRLRHRTRMFLGPSVCVMLVALMLHADLPASHAQTGDRAATSHAADGHAKTWNTEPGGDSEERRASHGTVSVNRPMSLRAGRVDRGSDHRSSSGMRVERDVVTKIGAILDSWLHETGTQGEVSSVVRPVVTRDVESESAAHVARSEVAAGVDTARRSGRSTSVSAADAVERNGFQLYEPAAEMRPYLSFAARAERVVVLDAPSMEKHDRLAEKDADSTAPEPVTLLLVLIGLAAVLARISMTESRARVV